MANNSLNPGDLVPRPDPTKLTTDAVLAARKDIENLFNAKLANVEQKIADNQRLSTELFKSARELTEQSITAAERAIIKGENATSARFESVNEFRRALSDQSSTFLTR